MILDDGGDATLFMLLGSKAETDPQLIAKPKSEEEECLYAEIAQAPEGAARAGSARIKARCSGRVGRDDDGRAPAL